MNIGIIAEDNSDVSVLREITLNLLRPQKIGFKSFVGHGCGKLRRKCEAWAINLVKRGCPYIVVVHDLDNHDENQLRGLIGGALQAAKPKASVILIPKREIETWLMYDARAIATAFRQTTLVQLPSDPEGVKDAKNHLSTMIWKHYRKDYLNTVHNQQIARHIKISLLKKAKSFAPHPAFVLNIKTHLKK